jgi:hypothetical protein
MKLRYLTIAATAGLTLALIAIQGSAALLKLRRNRFKLCRQRSLHRWGV